MLYVDAFAPHVPSFMNAADIVENNLAEPNAPAMGTLVSWYE